MNNIKRTSGVSTQERNVLLLELWDSSVSIVIRLLAGRQKSGVTLPRKG